MAPYQSSSYAGYYNSDPSAQPPYIYGINPNMGVSTAPGYIEIYGAHLAPPGTTPQVSMTGANLWIVYQSDNQINVYYNYVSLRQQWLSGTANRARDAGMNAWVTVSPYAPSQQVTVTVTSNGYWGNPWMPQYPSQPRSGSSTAMVQAAQPATASVLSASIPEDRIRVVLSPAGTSGTLTVELPGGTNHTVCQGGRGGGIPVGPYGVTSSAAGD